MDATPVAPTADRGFRGHTLSIGAYAVVFAAAFFMECWRAGGSSALLCPDYFSDERTIRECLFGSSCNFRGIDSSVPGFINPAGWFHARAALELLGLDLESVHHLIFVGNAFGAVLAALWATRLGGRVAGAISAAIFVGWIIPLSDGIACTRSPAPLLLLGAVFLATYLRAMQRPHFVTIVLAALCGGVMASIYSSTASAVVSVALLGMVAPRRRLALTIAAVAVFASFAYVTAPSGWLVNVRGLSARSGHRLGALGSWDIDGFIVFTASAGIVVAWMRAARSAPTLHKAMKGPLAVMLPPVAVLLGASLAGWLPFTYQYIMHAGPAAAVAAALPCAVALRAHIQGTTVRPRSNVIRTGARWIVPCVIIARISMELFVAGLGLDTLTAEDARRVTNVLVARGWTWPKALRSLQTPERNALRALHESLPQGPDVQDSTDAILLNVPMSRLPQPLPPNWTIANTAGRRATVLVFSTSWLDWRSLRVCVLDASTGEEQCQDTGRVMAHDGLVVDYPVQVAGFPLPAEMDRPVVVRLHVRIVVPAGAETSKQRIAMRTLPMGCHGRILAVTQPEGGPAAVDADGRGALLAQSSRGTPSEVVFEWIIGGPDCSSWSVVPRFPPFVVEGDPETVSLVESALEGS